jgi:hypothetical protein
MGQLEDGLMPSTIPGSGVHGKIAMILLESTDIAQDRSQRPGGLCDWKAVEASVGTIWTGSKERVMMGWCSCDARPWYARKRELLQGMDACLFTCFVDAHETAQAELPKLWGDPLAASSPEERTILAESRAEVAKARAALAGLSATHGGAVRFTENVQVVHYLLNEQRKAIAELKESGACSEIIARELLEEVEDDAGRLERDSLPAAEARKDRESLVTSTLLGVEDGHPTHGRGSRGSHGDHLRLGHQHDGVNIEMRERGATPAV